MDPENPFLLWEYGPSEIDNTTSGYGFCLSDQFKVGRISLMLGIRAETQKVFNDSGDEIWSWGLGDFLSPRASIAIDLLNDGKNILKFGYGQFANMITPEYLSFFTPAAPAPLLSD